MAVARKIQTAPFTNKDDQLYSAVYSTHVSGNLIRKRYSALIKELATLLCKMHRGSLVFNYGSKAISSTPADLVRVLSEWSQNDLVDLTIRNIIVDTILSSENKQIGSGIICALSLINYETRRYHIDEEALMLPFYREPAVITDLENAIDYFLGGGLLSRIALESIKRGALGGSVRFDISRGKDFVLHAANTEKIDGHIHPLFSHRIKKLYLPHVVCVDGIIESLGEIDKILQESADSKNNVVICALGFHPDVVNTLSENWKENRLKVLPFIVTRWSSNQEETALEACSKLGLNCVSRDKGETMNTQGLEDFSVLESVYLASKNMSIPSNLGLHTYLEIQIPNTMKDVAGVIEDRVRIAIQACVGIAASGKMKNNKILEYSKALGLKTPAVSSYAGYIGLKSAASCKNNIVELGAAVIPDIL